MASEADKKKAQDLVDGTNRLYDKAKTAQEKEAWAKDTLPKMDKAISLNPENTEAWNNRGGAKIALDDYKGAIDDCAKAIEIDPENAIAWSNRGSAKIELGDHQGAIDDYTKAIELDPKSVKALSNRGLSKKELGNHEDAITDCTKAIKLDPKFAPAWRNLGAIKNDLGDHQGAIDDYTKAIELDPKDTITWNNLGVARNALGDHENAITDCSQAIKFNPKNAAAWSNRGTAKYHLGRYEDALKDFDEALRLEPKNEAIQRNRQAVDVAKKQNEYLGQLEERVKRFNEKYDNNIKWRNVFFAIVVLFIPNYIGYFIHKGEFSGISSNPLGVLPFLALLFTILSPFIWLIRLNIKYAERNLIMREDFYSRHIVELYLDRFFTEERDRQEFAQKYIAYWMYNDPSETLIRLANKSKEKPELPQARDIVNITKNAKLSPTDPQS